MRTPSAPNVARTSEALNKGLDLGWACADAASDLGAFEAGDTNNDWVVDWLDVGKMAQDWLGTGVLTDIDLSGSVDFADFALMAQFWVQG